MKLRQAELAWPGGDTPGKLRFKGKVADYAAEIIIKALRGVFPDTQIDDHQITALQPTSDIPGRYRFSCKSGDWFVRISARLGHPELEKSVIDHLSASGLTVNPIVAFQLVELDGQQFRLDVRPFLRGRHFNGSLDDIARVACHLRMVHRALANFEGAGQIHQIASHQYEGLAGIKDRMAHCLARGNFDFFAEHAEWAREQARWLRDLVEMFDPRLQFSPLAQCIHGEVHPGNVIFSQEGEVVLVDFEESVHHFTSPLWDLTFLVQRFCLGDDPEEALLRERLSVVAEQYGTSLQGLSLMMRQIAWYSVAMLLHYRLNHVVSPRSEWDKFVRLERQARTLEHIL
ncbi:MAG: aminoglycoside phosphotransferase family protein [Desulfobaccales bacterium]